MPPLPDPYVSVDEVFGQRAGKPFAAFGPREYTRYFRVVVNDKTVGQVAVCYAPNVPRPFSPYFSADVSEYDPYSLLVGLSAREENAGDWQSWIVTCEYSTTMPPGGIPAAPGYPSLGPGTGGGAANNPELSPPVVNWDYQETSRTVTKDLSKPKNKPLVNSAGQPFTPTPTFEGGYYILTIERNELIFTRAIAESYAWALNDADFLGSPKGKVQCLPPRASQQYLGTLPYYRVTYRLRFAPPWMETWQPEILDQGLCKLQKDPALGDFNKPVPIVRGGHKVSQPVLLNGSGDEADILNDNGVLKPVPFYLKFEIYPYKSLTKLLEGGVGGP